MLAANWQQNFEKLIAEQKLLSSSMLEKAKLQAVKEGQPLDEVIAELKLLDSEDVTKIKAVSSGYPYVNLSSSRIDPQVLAMVPKTIAETYTAVPIGLVDGRLNVAMVDPSNLQAIDFLTRKTGQQIVAFMASKSSIERVIATYPSDIAAEISEAVTNAEHTDATVKDVQKERVDAKALQNLVQDAPITRALNTILEYAVNARASDIHIEPREHELKIRYRVDGILQDTMTLPKSIEPALISRIKILSNLKIDEHRIPQDGQFGIEVGKNVVDLRIAIAPVVYGEQVVIRLLNKTAAMLTLEDLGFRGRAYRLIIEGIHKPHGMTISTGPTGSGKSTTLYAVIQKLKDVSINIVTLEDPVEYKMDGINQIQVNPAVGLTFAGGLRSILRQDPNVIMVGEIRDRETADLAVQAALTGHVVLSTLHTNSAPGVLPRLLDMKIEPFLIASTINTVIGQRLVRQICQNCRQEVPATEAGIKMIQDKLAEVLPKAEADRADAAADLGYDNLPLIGQKAYTLYKGVGCENCTNGYSGRIGIYEVFGMNTAMERLLVQKATTKQVQDQAMADGMLTMQQDGLLKALSGVTTLEEVARVAADY